MQKYSIVKGTNIFLISLNNIIYKFFFLFSISMFLLSSLTIMNETNKRKLLTQSNLKKQYYNFFLLKNISHDSIKVDTASYINNNIMLARQIDNTNLQVFIVDAKNSILKLIDFTNKKNNKNYSYNSYGMPIPIKKNQNIKLSFFQKITKNVSNVLSNIPNNFQYNGERFDSNTSL